jgi:hypothetical protein
MSPEHASLLVRAQRSLRKLRKLRKRLRAASRTALTTVPHAFDTPEPTPEGGSAEPAFEAANPLEFGLSDPESGDEPGWEPVQQLQPVAGLPAVWQPEPAWQPEPEPVWQPQPEPEPELEAWQPEPAWQPPSLQTLQDSEYSLTDSIRLLRRTLDDLCHDRDCITRSIAELREAQATYYDPTEPHPERPPPHGVPHY